MEAIYYHVDAFTDHIFGGNPAGVCPLNSWLADETLQKIAAENNLSETAFFVRISNGHYDLRWLTPVIEVDLCGHATLATAHVLWKHEGETSKILTFQTKSGPLTVTREENELLALNFPTRPAKEITEPEGLVQAFGLSDAPVWIGLTHDRFLIVFKSGQEVLDAVPNFNSLSKFSPGRFILSGPGENDIDFVSRFFAPDAGVLEDPVTGSAHCTLIPYWAERLGKTVLQARQVSARGGELFCEIQGERVKIAGRAVTYSKGSIEF